MKKTLSEMRSGESGTVEAIDGGFGLSERLDALGIRPGKKVTKVSAHFWRGPNVLSVDGRKVALGFGMARRIIVEVSPE